MRKNRKKKNLRKFHLLALFLIFWQIQKSLHRLASASEKVTHIEYSYRLKSWLQVQVQLRLDSLEKLKVLRKTISSLKLQ